MKEKSKKLLSVTLHCQNFTKHLYLFDSRTKLVYEECRHFFPKRACHCTQLLLLTRKCPVFVLASLTHPNCAGALPHKLGHWFCSQNLWLSSGKTFGSECQKTGSCSDLKSATVAAPKSENTLCGVWNLFRSVDDGKIEDSYKLISTIIPQTVPLLQCKPSVVASSSYCPSLGHQC